MSSRLEKLAARGLASATDAVPGSSSAPSVAAIATSSQTRRRGKTRRRKKRTRADLELRKLELHGAAAGDVPNLPYLKHEVRGRNLRVARDRSGREARAVLADLPIAQALALIAAAAVALPKVRRGTAHSVTRAELARAELPTDLDELELLLPDALEVFASEWGRRLVAAAWALWAHRRRISSRYRNDPRSRTTFGGVFEVQGFPQGALAWLVPKPDGSVYCRSSLFRAGGAFMLLGAESRPLGKERGPAGLGLFTRHQPPHNRARFVGPYRANGERYALAVHRYDKGMSGKNFRSLARRAGGYARKLAQLLSRYLTPWLELAPKVVRLEHPELDELAPPPVLELAADELARGPPGT